MRKSLVLALLVLFATSRPTVAEAQSSDPWPDFERARVALLAGLIQPLLLQGGNVEMDLYYGRLVVGYSHGFLLQLNGDTVTGEAAQQGLEFTIPFSTGLSVGYRFLEWLDVRVESKIHRFDVRDAASGRDLFSYTTFTFGFGAYAQYRPFYDFDVSGDFDDWLHGFMLVGSVRFWPTVWTELPRDQREFDSPTTGRLESHQAAEIGIANTPIIVNLAVGYSVTF